MRKFASIVECPSNLGLKEPFPGHQPGVRLLPDWLKLHGFHRAMGDVAVMRVAPPAYAPGRDSATGLLNAESLVEYTRELADVVEEELRQEQLPLLLGGDCSILVGAALGLRRSGRYAVFYLDGHTDFMDVTLSQTGGAGGMAASMAVGRGAPSICAQEGYAGYIEESLMYCAGNREYHEEYQNQIRRSRATYWPLHQLREKGMKTAAEQFLQEIDGQRVDGFWLHFDVDVLDDNMMPCVDSRTPDGLSYAEWGELLIPLLTSRLLAGISITILDPELDPRGKYSKRLIREFSHCWRFRVELLQELPG